ncbi:MAG TPA: M56 family metallopeptidase [Terriglobales bacterium]|nr:M56 family metallopeptidase [Terriglobales bacterium]
MFAARGIIVSVSVFVIVYCVLSLVVACGWRRAWGRAQRFFVGRAAGVLFALRMFPLITAGLITAALTVPSFLLLEPRAIDEPVGGVSLALGACGLILGLVGILSAAIGLRRASRAVAEWTRGARPAESATSVPVLTISPASPAMTATGILRPRILLSGAAELQLTDGELQAALNHELAHIRRADNLKKLLMRFAAFPGMRGLEAAWLESAEMAADDAAITTTRDALDLAAALIKLSRMVPEAATTDLTAALVRGPRSAVHARVERLLAWCEENSVAAGKHSRWYRLSCGLAATFAAIAMFALSYRQLLVHVHTATEWLVR